MMRTPLLVSIVASLLGSLAAGCGKSAALPGDTDGGGDGSAGAGGGQADGKAGGAGGGTAGSGGGGGAAGGAGGGDPMPDAPIPPGTSPVGGPCALAGDCVGPAAGTMQTGPSCYTAGTGFAGGYCSLRGCDPVTQNCPGGADAVCVTFGGGGMPSPDRNVCLAACGDGLPACRPGYRCATFGSKKACWLGCNTDADCPSGQTCAKGSGGGVGECKMVMPKTVGEPCKAASECDGDYCLSEKDYGYPYGYCTDSCMGDQKDCGGGVGVCVVYGGGGYGECYRKCSTDADCRPGYRCNSYGRDRPQKWCDPRCTLDSQCENKSCHAGTGHC